MKNFLKAIIDRFNAGQIAAVATKLYNTEAERTAVFPYVVFTVDNIQDLTFSERFEDFTIQFDIYSDKPSVEEVCDLFELLTDADLGGFDFVDLDITGFTSISLRRENSHLAKWDIEGKLVWDWYVIYRVKIQRN